MEDQIGMKRRVVITERSYTRTGIPTTPVFTETTSEPPVVTVEKSDMPLIKGFFSEFFSLKAWAIRAAHWGVIILLLAIMFWKFSSHIQSLGHLVEFNRYKTIRNEMIKERGEVIFRNSMEGKTSSYNVNDIIEQYEKPTTGR